MLLALLSGAHRLAGLLPNAVSWVETTGGWAPVMFIGIYGVATVALVPGSLLTIAAGALFGLGRGTLIAFAGAVIGETAAFLVSRHLLRRFVVTRLQASPRFAALDRALAADGLRLVFLLRLSPLFPFTLLNYAIGASQVRFRDYLLASFGMLPGTLLYVYYGRVLGDVAALATDGAVPKGFASYALLVLGLLATLAATILITRRARRELAAATEGALE
ncbi:MAG: TVP38/TMEM64 family protein [Gemmatimonadales bacterium]